MLTALEGLTGVTCLMDDILIHGSNQQHDERLIAVLEKLQKFHVTLKNVFSTSTVKFLGHVIDQEGTKPDPSNTRHGRA